MKFLGYFKKQSRRFLSLLLIACMLLCNLSFAEEKLITEGNEQTVTVTEEASKTTIASDSETSSDEDDTEDEATNEKEEDEKTNDKEQDPEKENAEKEDASKDKVATESEVKESTVATKSELFGEYDDELGYDPASKYKVVFHFVMPEGAQSRGSSWMNSFDTPREDARIIERTYYTGQLYDETLAEPNPNTAPPVGVLCDVDLWDILKGYELIGWNTDEAAAKSGTKQYEISPAATTPLSTEKNVTIDLYSVFKLIPVTIEFNVNDATKGTGSTNADKSTFTSHTVCLGDSLSFIEDAEYQNLTRPGYDFIGWSKYQYDAKWRNLGPGENDVLPDHINLVDPSDTFSLSSVIHEENGAKIKPGNKYTFYAVWNPHAYKVYIHWPQFSKGYSYTYEQYIEGCKNAEPYEQWLIFDNDFEIIQKLNHMKGRTSPNRMRVAACIPTDFFAGVGLDPTCEDLTKVLWDVDTAYWGTEVPEDEEWHLYCILTPNIYRERVNIRVNLDGGYHRGFLDFRMRHPAGISYRKSLYPSLMSYLTKPGYLVDKVVEVGADGSETDFDFDRIASIKDKSQESLQRLADYEKYTAEAEPLFEEYWDVVKKRILLQEKYIPEGGGGISWEEFEKIPEAAALLAEEREKYAAYKEVAKKIPDSQDTWDLFLKVKWKGKTIEGVFDYNGNRGSSSKVDPASKTMTRKNVVYGQAIGELPTPKKTGYVFKGWKTGRSLFNQEDWKSVTPETIFESAEKNEPFLFGYTYDELQFTFYADYEGIPLHLKPQGGDHPEATVTINDFKFGEETILNISGTYKPSTNAGSKLFGTGEEQEAYGIEILDDYTTDGDSPKKVQEKGKQYVNGDKVTLYAGEDGNLNIKPLWRTKTNSGSDTPTDTPTNKPGDKQADNPNSNPGNDNNNNNNNNSTVTRVDNNNGSRGGNNSGSSVSPAQKNLQNQANKGAQKSLQQTISAGNFAKTTVNTSNLSINVLAEGSNNWRKDPTTGKFKLSGRTPDGRTIAVANSFAQVARTITNGNTKQTVNDTYYFDESGNMVTGWMKTSDNKWYFFDDSTGADEGKMSLGWKQVGGSWYYFTANGSMMTNGTTPDGYKVNTDGVWTQA